MAAGSPEHTEEFQPNGDELAWLREVAVRVRASEWTSEGDFLDVVSAIAIAEMPPRLGEVLSRLSAGDIRVLVMKGLPFRASDLPVTPRTYAIRTMNLSDVQIHQAVLVSQLGYLYGFTRQQSGRVFNDIIPVKELQDVANISGGTRHRFDFHTEDAFHPARPQWFSLAALRNPLRTPTQLSIPNPELLSSESMLRLREPVFLLRANPMQGGNEASTDERQSVVFHGRNDVAFRFNYCVADADGLGPEHVAALTELYDHLRNNEFSVMLEPGDCLLFDNERVFHARNPYEAEFEGGDRWLSRAVAATSRSSLGPFLLPSEPRMVVSL